MHVDPLVNEAHVQEASRAARRPARAARSLQPQGRRLAAGAVEQDQHRRADASTARLALRVEPGGDSTSHVPARRRASAGRRRPSRHAGLAWQGLSNLPGAGSTTSCSPAFASRPTSSAPRLTRAGGARADQAAAQETRRCAVARAYWTVRAPDSCKATCRRRRCSAWSTPRRSPTRACGPGWRRPSTRTARRSASCTQVATLRGSARAGARERAVQLGGRARPARRDRAGRRAADPRPAAGVGGRAGARRARAGVRR